MVPAVALLIAVYMGGISGGLVSAILLRIPGTAAFIATTFDGASHVPERTGREALAIGTFGSFIGELFSAFAPLAHRAVPDKDGNQIRAMGVFWNHILLLCLVSVLMGTTWLRD